MLDENSLKKNTELFYNTFLSNIENWYSHFDELKVFR